MMIFSVKNEFDTLSCSVRFAVSSCPENPPQVSIDRSRITTVTISLPCNVATGRSFVFAGTLWFGAVYSFAPAAYSFYDVVEDLARSFVAVVNGLVRRQLRVIASQFTVWKNHLSKKLLFSRQAVLSCAGGLRL